MPCPRCSPRTWCFAAPSRTSRTRAVTRSVSSCDFLHTRSDGLIDEFTVMLRPLKAVNAFAERMSEEFAKEMAQSGLSGPGLSG